MNRVRPGGGELGGVEEGASRSEDRGGHQGGAVGPGERDSTDAAAGPNLQAHALTGDPGERQRRVLTGDDGHDVDDRSARYDGRGHVGGDVVQGQVTAPVDEPS